MSLHQPRRIFVRRHRQRGLASSVRLGLGVVVLVAGLIAAQSLMASGGPQAVLVQSASR